MGNKQIGDLQLRSSVTDDLNVPSDDGIQSYRVTALMIKNYVLSLASIATTMIQDLAVTTGKLADSSVTDAKTSFTPPTIQKFTATGTQVGWVFTISSGNATVGATYTNNGNTFTVIATIAAQTTVWMSGTGATSGGTLTKATGTGDATLTFSSKVAYATYTKGTNAKYIRVRLVGGGGGGAGSGTGSSMGNGGAGTKTLFGAGMLVGNPGAGGNGQSIGGTGGVGSLGTGPIGTTMQGGQGGACALSNGSVNYYISGGYGGISTFGGGASGGEPNAVGKNAVDNSGSGGGGGGGAPIAGLYTGSGGGGGGSVDAIITSPAATYPYVIGDGGGAGTAGTSGFAGGVGGSGYIEVTEYYQ